MCNSTIEENDKLTVMDLNNFYFYVPGYQRGYRWGARQVKELLDDILEFAERTTPQKVGQFDDGRNKSKEIYCLQPLVVKEGTVDEKDDNGTMIKKKCWRVIDGQQRLTTLKLIIGYIKYNCISLNLQGIELPEFFIEYETRDGSRDFIEELIDYKSSGANKNKLEYIDYYFLSSVYEEICNWFSALTDGAKRRVFFDCLFKRAKFIWYVSDDKEQNTFKNLNEGKIPLTSSELIKAMFMNRNNFPGCEGNALDIRQHNIAFMWDSIENMLQNDEFWLFVYPDISWKKPTRIDYIFDLICETDSFDNVLSDDSNDANDKIFNDKTEKDKAIGSEKDSDGYRTYRYFDSAFRHAKEYAGQSDLNWLEKYWEKVEDTFAIFKEWYYDYEYYHYIGFLVATCPSKTIVSYLKTLLDLWIDSNSKKEFLDKLNKEIINRLKDGRSSWIKVDNKEAGSKEAWLNHSFGDEGENKTSCRDILLLFNIETMIRRNKVLVEKNRMQFSTPNFNKFAFHMYKSEKWDIEHIASASGDDLDTDKDRIRFLYFAYSQNILGNDSECLKVKDKSGNTISDKEAILELLSREEIKDFYNGDTKDIKDKNLHEVIDKYVKNLQDEYKGLDSYDKNQIGNYTLLDQSTNRGYQNHIFPIKRLFIRWKEDGKKPDFKGSKYDYEKDDQGNYLYDMGYKVPNINFLTVEDSSFFPICTMDVFLKKYNDTPGDMFKWTDEDAEAYAGKIFDTLQAKYIKDIE